MLIEHGHSAAPIPADKASCDSVSYLRAGINLGNAFWPELASALRSGVWSRVLHDCNTSSDQEADRNLCAFKFHMSLAASPRALRAAPALTGICLVEEHITRILQ